MRLSAALLSTLMVSHAAADCLERRGTVEVVAWHAPLTAELDDGVRVRLADLRPAPGAAAYLLPLGPAELTALPASDRWGRVSGDIVAQDTGVSLRTALVRDGLAFIDPAVMPLSCDARLRAEERRAADGAHGLWADVSILDARSDQLTALAGEWALVDGVVQSVGRTRRTVYLNFGDHHRTDFTVMIDRGVLQGWTLDPTSLTGVRVRVRGVLEAWNGGLIRIEHPAQIEQVD